MTPVSVETVHRPNTTTPYPQVQLSLESSHTQATRHCKESNLIQVVSSISFQSGIWNVWGRHQGCSCGAVIPKSVEEQSVWQLTEYACWVSNEGNPISLASPWWLIVSYTISCQFAVTSFLCQLHKEWWNSFSKLMSKITSTWGVLQGRVVSPALNPQPGGPGYCLVWPLSPRPIWHGWTC